MREFTTFFSCHVNPRVICSSPPGDDIGQERATRYYGAATECDSVHLPHAFRGFGIMPRFHSSKAASQTTQCAMPNVRHVGYGLENCDASTGPTTRTRFLQLCLDLFQVRLLRKTASRLGGRVRIMGRGQDLDFESINP